MIPFSSDQLRWELAPDLHVCLDTAENIVIEAAGRRVAVPHPAMMAEALRQAQAAQIGNPPPDPSSFALRNGLLKLAEEVADLGDTEPADLGEASEVFQSLAAEARTLLGRPGPVEVLDPLPPFPAAAPSSADAGQVPDAG